MKNILNKVSLDKSLKILLGIIFISPMIYKPLSIVGYNTLSALTVLLVTSIVYIYVAMHLLKNTLNFKSLTIYFLYFVLLLLLTNLILDNELSFRYIGLVYFIGIYYIVSRFTISVQLLLKITNYTYIIYIILSFLVYISAIDWFGEKLNIFYYHFGEFITFKTFIGFYGSTANLDSYSLLIVLLNIFYNKNKSKYIFVGLAAFISFGTLRFTPFISLFIAIFITSVIFVLSKAYEGRSLLKHKTIVTFFALIVFTMFYQILYLSQINKLLEIFGSFTSGRNKIWLEMWNVYKTLDEPLNKLLGFGDTNNFNIKPFGYYGMETINPHNNFMKLLIEYGAFIFISFLIFVIKNMINITKISSLIICFYILLVGNTNSEIFDYVTPVYVIWLFKLFISEKNIKKNSYYF